MKVSKYWSLVHQTVGGSTFVTGNVKSIGNDRCILHRRFGAHGSRSLGADMIVECTVKGVEYFSYSTPVGETLLALRLWPEKDRFTLIYCRSVVIW